MLGVLLAVSGVDLASPGKLQDQQKRQAAAMTATSTPQVSPFSAAHGRDKTRLSQGPGSASPCTHTTGKSTTRTAIATTRAATLHMP